MKKRLIIDKYISQYSKDMLISLGYTIIETRPLLSVKNSTATHPDMQFFYCGYKKALVAPEVFDYYSGALPDFELTPVFGIGEKYPDDCVLNIAKIGDRHILTKHQYRALSIYGITKPTYVKQGYVKCSTCILNDNAVISADKGIISALEKIGVRAYFLPDRDILLQGYKNGFWGGATGLIGDDRLFFNGNIEALPNYDELIQILNKEKIEPFYHTYTPLCDNGSIILLPVE